jgi:cephalosporin hydroxylase
MFKLKSQKRIVEDFHKLYYNSKSQTWGNTFWLGVPCFKCPLDPWIYQEIVYQLRPDLIIECGTAAGGTALFLATICELVDRGIVVTIDIEDYQSRPRHDRIRYLKGSSISKEVLTQVKGFADNAHSTIVILDSDHSRDHVLQELRMYSEFVSVGSYIIVEDTNIGGHPVKADFGPGPAEAVEEFLRENNKFVVDRTHEKFYLTFNPNGYLKKIK